MPNRSMPTRLIVGCGYVGQRVAERWLKRNDRVLAVTRGGTRLENLKSLGIEPVVWDWLNDTSESMPSIDGTIDTILVSVSHAAVEGVAWDETHTRGLSKLHAALLAMGCLTDQTRWIYLSTTGVFANPIEPPQRINSDLDSVLEREALGNHNETEHGAIHADTPRAHADDTCADDTYLDVDEDSPVEAKRPGSVAAIAGETWFSQTLGVANAGAHRDTSASYTILRPAGIYGPARLPRWQDLKEARPMEADPNSYLNLIHVDDLAGVITHVADRKMQHTLYCVSDLEPTRRGEYYRWIADFFGWPSPQFVSFLPSDGGKANSSPKRVSRSDGNKRVRSVRLRSETQYEFVYPTFREGIASLAPTIES